MASGSVAVQVDTALGEYSPATRPVDLVHLAKQCLGDHALECEMLRLFDATLGDYHARLRLAASFDDIALILHSIKGAAGGVGASGLAETTKSMEREIRSGRPLTQERIDDLGLVIEDVRAFIDRVLATEEA